MPRPRMSDATYKAVQSQLLLISRMMSVLDTDGFLERIVEAETVGPIVNPTLFMKGSDSLQSVRQIAEAASVFKNKVLIPVTKLAAFT